MSRWPEDRGGRQPEGRRARQPEGRRGRHTEGRRGRQDDGRRDPDDTLPWLAGLEEASTPEEDADWARKLRPRQPPRVDMPGPAGPAEPPASAPGPPEMGTPPPGGPGAGAGAPGPADWRAAGPAVGTPHPEPGEQTRAWGLDGEPAAPAPGAAPQRDTGYGSWAHELDATATWEPEPRDWTDPPKARPSWEQPPADPAGRPSWEPEASWNATPAVPSSPTWDPEPRPAEGQAAGRPAPWEVEEAPFDASFGGLFAEPGRDRLGGLQGATATPDPLTGPDAPGGLQDPDPSSGRVTAGGPSDRDRPWSGAAGRPETEDETFAAAQAEARRLVEQASTQSWKLEPSWPEQDDRPGLDEFTDEPVVSFGSPPGRTQAPPLAPGPNPPPAAPGTDFSWAESPRAEAGPGRALEPVGSGWDHPGAATDPPTQAWEPRGEAAAGADDDWLWPVDQEHEAHTPGGWPAPQPEGGWAGDRQGRAGAVIEGRRARQLEGRTAQAGRSDGRRVRQRDSRVRRRWPLRLAVLAWIVLFAVVCWLYIFPWLEGVLPENF
jgi:hypothetical protein